MKPFNRIVAGLLSVGLFAAFASAQERYLLPVDEAKSDPSFGAFRTKLIAAAERRDAKYILSILDPKIQLSFGGHAGSKDFMEMWKIDRPDSKFWDEFLPVIKNGGGFYDEPETKTRIFYAPYSFHSFPEDLDAFEHKVIFGNNVNLRERPSIDSTVVAVLSYNIVKVDLERPASENGGTGSGWERVETLGGKKGFVKNEFVRSPVDYRAGFAKRRGVWKMITFVAGD